MADNAGTGPPGAEELPAQHQQPCMKHDNNYGLPELSVDEVPLPDSISTATRQLMKDKDREWKDVKRKGVALTLLNLPVDVLRLIVNEVTYSNDLIALALTHSALYELAMPNMYSRFDIVWPESTASSPSSKSVDALSYGLATLCLPNRFAEIAKRSRGASLGRLKGSHRLSNSEYARHIRKFSLGNGPSEWTSEYLIIKESGKMLNTLAAIAVSKMENLETFVWDMPTGVLSDVFMALSSLQDDQGQAKLEKVWVRWHESITPGSSTASSPTTALPPLNAPPPPPQSIPMIPLSALASPVGHYVSANTDNATSPLTGYAHSRVEYPTFSVLSPLRSLTVLNIDDLSYLDEMSVLIERSVSRLRELRVGISEKAHKLHDLQPWDGVNLQQVDHEAKWPGESRIPSTRLGGVLGVLVGRIYDIRRTSDPDSHGKSVPELDANPIIDGKATGLANETNGIPQPQKTANGDMPDTLLNRKRLDGKLKLETLELERVTLSIAVCSKAIDWSIMTTLTILGCQHHDSLWKALRRQFRPTAPAHGSPQDTPTRYHLALKHITTDLVSPAFISFMKETLAPNTLESIFLLDRRDRQKPPVAIEQIFKSTAKRHRNSLKRLLIDSSDRKETAAGILQTTSRRHKHWAIKDEHLSYITSGRMTNLRELGIVIDYKDWHTLLQQLPQMANLRSLYIPEILSSYTTTLPTSKELALQILDIVTLRREIQLTYLGLCHKCFEIAEVDRGDAANPSREDDAVPVDDADHTDGISDDETDEEDDGIDPFGGADDEFTDETSDDGQSEADSFTEARANKSLPRLRLLKIPFYEDKVELFRARHGRL